MCAVDFNVLITVSNGTRNFVEIFLSRLPFLDIFFNLNLSFNSAVNFCR